MRRQPLRLALGLFAVALSYAATISVAWAQAESPDAAQAESAQAGRVEFDHPGGGEPAVQIDLPAGLWSDVVGLGDAAVAGLAEGLLQAKAEDAGLKGQIKLAADQLAGIRAVMSAVQGAVGEVRVCVYRGEEGVEASANGGAIADFYTKKLAGSEWARIVQAREGEKCASVFLLRRDGAIRGVFVVATKGRELALVNVLCDVSPDRVKQITHEATNIGLELGGDEGLRELLNELHKH